MRKGSNDHDPIVPFNPLFGKPKKVGKKEIELLGEWIRISGSVSGSAWVSDSVRDSVMDSVWDSVWDSVLDSVLDSVWDSVWYSVWGSVSNLVRDSVFDSVFDSVSNSVWDSICAYNSSILPGVNIWEGIDHTPVENPFQPGIDLWKSGFVPSFDGETWRLHSGKDAEIVYETRILTG